MERDTHVPHLALGLLLPDKIIRAEAFDRLKPVRVHAVEQVKIDIIGLQPPELIGEYLLHALRPVVLHHPDRQFGREIKAFPRIFLHRLAQELLRFAAVVSVRGVVIVYACGIGAVQ